MKKDAFATGLSSVPVGQTAPHVTFDEVIARIERQLDDERKRKRRVSLRIMGELEDDAP